MKLLDECPRCGSLAVGGSCLRVVDRVTRLRWKLPLGPCQDVTVSVEGEEYVVMCQKPKETA